MTDNTKNQKTEHDLEEIVAGEKVEREEKKEETSEISAKLSEGRFHRYATAVYRYAVDVLSGWLYYTPTYALQELAVGKDVESVAKTRLLGMAVHLLTIRPIGLLRNYVAQKWGVTQESSFGDKLKVNLAVITPIQTVVYAGMLLGEMAWSGKYDWKHSLYAWGIGVGLGALHAFPYGVVQDRVRGFFGVPPAIARQRTEQG